MGILLEVEKLLDEGCDISCANIIGGCAEYIKHGDSYVIKNGYMYCCQECADEDNQKE